VSRKQDLSVVVIKFGGSVLKRDADLALAVHEVHRHVRAGQRVVAVTSAFAGRTDALFARAATFGPDASEESTAALVALGEEETSALLALALDRAGLRTEVLSPSALGIRVEGSALSATVASTDATNLRAALNRAEVVVVPGFVGVTATGSIALLGRGGSDLTAVLLAEALDSDCILIKDVDGLYDPLAPEHSYASISYFDAAALNAKAFQSHALAEAASRHRTVYVGRAVADRLTRVGHFPTTRSSKPREACTTVALLGLGTVGRGVYERLIALEDRFELLGVAVRDVGRHAASGVPRSLLTTNGNALAREADLVIEVMGGGEPAASIVEASLRRGAQVVTANKSLVAAHGIRLGAVAQAHGAALRFSASVGGVAPCLELVERRAQHGRVVQLEGVLNGTTNFILEALCGGESMVGALALAQRRGYAEADPSADVDGIDAAEKLRILCRLAFGREPDECTVEGIRNVDSGPSITRLVARARITNGALIASVRPEQLGIDHPLADVRGCWNRLLVTTDDGVTFVAHGKGAGRWPTTESIIADALDAHRAIVRAASESGALRTNEAEVAV